MSRSRPHGVIGWAGVMRTGNRNRIKSHNRPLGEPDGSLAIISFYPRIAT